MMMTKAAVVGSSSVDGADAREVPPPPPPKEVPPPPPVEAAPIAQLHPVDIWSVNMFLEAFRRLRQVAVELGLPQPNCLL
jgi:hypothetical protein